MKQVRCSFQGHFYVEVPDNFHADMVEDTVDLTIHEIESVNEELFCIDEYDWEVADNV